MKHKGCIPDFTDRRNMELMAAYRKACSQARTINTVEISTIVAESPCSRFWVSEDRAYTVILAMVNGKNVIDSMLPHKREMFQEIYKRALEFKEQYPDENLSYSVFRAVNSPAPKFYLNPRCVMEIIYKIRNGYYENRQRRY